MKLNELTIFAKLYFAVVNDYSETSYHICGINDYNNRPCVHLLSIGFEKLFSDKDYTVTRNLQPSGKVFYERRIIVDDVLFYSLAYTADELTKKDRLILGLPGEDF